MTTPNYVLNSQIPSRLDSRNQLQTSRKGRQGYLETVTRRTICRSGEASGKYVTAALRGELCLIYVGSRVRSKELCRQSHYTAG